MSPLLTRGAWLALALSLPAAQAAPAPRFTLQPIALAPIAALEIRGIGDGGHLIGHFSLTDGAPGGTAFVAERDGSLRSLASLAEDSLALGVNAQGWVVGRNGNEAALWRADGSLLSLPGQLASAINDAAQVVGNRADGSAYRWSAAGGEQTLAGLPGGSLQLQGINAQGVALGTSWLPTGARLTLIAPDQAPRTLPGLEDGWSEAIAISATGAVLGRGNLGGFVWDAQRGLRDTVGLTPIALNTAGQVLGHTELGRPALWKDGQIIELAAHSGLPISQAGGINRHAQIGVATAFEGLPGAAVLTLHPDWEGGSGRWHDGLHWNWAGTGVAAADLGSMHEALIAPEAAVVVSLDGEAEVGSLRIAGSESLLGVERAELHLEGGVLRASQSADAAIRFEAFSLLSGRGRLQAGTMSFATGAGLRLLEDEQLDLQGDLRLEAGATLELQLGSRLVVDGDVAMSHPILKLQWGSQALAAGQHYDLIDWSGELQTPDGWTVQVPLLPEGLVLNHDRLWLDGSVSIQAVPEPGAWLLFGVGLPALLLRRHGRIPAKARTLSASC